MSFPRRRKLLVHSLQFHLLAAVLIYFLAAIAGVIVVVFGPLVWDFSGPSTSTLEEYEAAGVFLRLHQQFWPVILGLVVLIIAHAILISHRIGGPLYRFRSVFQAVGGGDLSMRVRLRKHDLAKREALELDRMIAQLRQRIRGIRQQCHELETAAQTVASDEAKRLELSKRIENLRDSLDTFQLGLEPDSEQPSPEVRSPGSGRS